MLIVCQYFVFFPPDKLFPLFKFAPIFSQAVLEFFFPFEFFKSKSSSRQQVIFS